MGTFKLRSFTLVPFRLIFFFFSFFILFTCNVTATSPQLISNFNPQQDDGSICSKAFCGKGKCHPSPDLLGFKCECDPGWKKPDLLPSCVLPNCTVDFSCGNGAPPPPPHALLNISDACIFNLCGDGTCEKDGSGFRCRCDDGAANLFNDPKWTCFKKCSLGGDCNGLDLGSSFDPPASGTPLANPFSPPPPTSGSPETGLGEIRNSSRQLHMLTTLILSIMFLKWI